MSRLDRYVVEIRRSITGKDIRQPTAEAIEIVKDEVSEEDQGTYIKKIQDAKALADVIINNTQAKQNTRIVDISFVAASNSLVLTRAK